MKFYFAPMQGVTGYNYRNVHRAFFPTDIDKYFTPFITANQSKKFRTKELKELLPENNLGVPLIPQLLTNRADDFIHATKRIHQLGYDEINLNLGCPARTVVTKKKGAGFLADPKELDSFFDEVFSNQITKISVKTRIGMHEPEEWDRLIEIYNRYPIEELIIHPRTQADFYENKPNLTVFRAALRQSKNPVCYNGDIVTAGDYQNFIQDFDDVESIMIGRGLLINPGLVSEIIRGETLQQETLLAFHDAIYRDYQRVLSGERNVLFAMKEIWAHMIMLFPSHAKYEKKIKKSQNYLDYDIAVAQLFKDRQITNDQ